MVCFSILWRGYDRQYPQAANVCCIPHTVTVALQDMLFLPSKGACTESVTSWNNGDNNYQLPKPRMWERFCLEKPATNAIGRCLWSQKHTRNEIPLPPSRC